MCLKYNYLTIFLGDIVRTALAKMTGIKDFPQDSWVIFFDDRDPSARVQHCPFIIIFLGFFKFLKKKFLKIFENVTIT